MIINNNFEVLICDDKLALISGDVEHVYILNQIESEIWKTFEKDLTIEESYNFFIDRCKSVYISKSDYAEFVNTMKYNGILVG